MMALSLINLDFYKALALSRLSKVRALSLINLDFYKALALSK